MENDILLEPGRYDLILNASDRINRKITQITVRIEGAKGPVWVEPLEDQTLEVGESLHYDLNDTDISDIDRYWVNSTHFAIDENGILTNTTDLTSGTYWIKVSVNDTLGHTTTSTLKVSVQTPDTPSNGNSSPNDLVLILGIVGIVGAVGLGASIVGLLFIRSRRSELDQN